jgi:uncharacterized protein with FMN-binding domain
MKWLDQKKRNWRNKMNGWIIVPIIVSILGIGGGFGWSNLLKEHREAANLPLNRVDFNKLNDGTYHGAYAGGMYKWRANECDVTVSSGKVIDIQLASSKDPGAENTQYKVLYDRVVEAQSLQVDTISSATLTSKAYLQAIENALVQAEHE